MPYKGTDQLQLQPTRRWSSSSEGGFIWLEMGMEDAVPDSKILILINEQIKNLNMIFSLYYVRESYWDQGPSSFWKT